MILFCAIATVVVLGSAIVVFRWRLNLQYWMQARRALPASRVYRVASAPVSPEIPPEDPTQGFARVLASSPEQPLLLGDELEQVEIDELGPYVRAKATPADTPIARSLGYDDTGVIPVFVPQQRKPSPDEVDQ
jgi:hypothetical protein